MRVRAATFSSMEVTIMSKGDGASLFEKLVGMGEVYFLV